MFSMPRSMNESTSSIRMSPSSLRLARPMCSRSTAISTSITSEGGLLLRDDRSRDQYLVLRPVGMRAPLIALPKDVHGMWVALKLVHRGVEAGQVGVFSFENEVVEVALDRRPRSRLG